LVKEEEENVSRRGMLSGWN